MAMVAVGEEKMSADISDETGKFDSVDNDEENVLRYNFSKNELYLLAKFLRMNQEVLPKGLETFYKTLEDSIYNSLSLEEVKRFYS